MALHLFESCIQDCSEVLSKMPDNVKAVKRKAYSYMMMFEFDNAEFWYRKGLEIDSKDKELVNETKELKVYRDANSKYQALMSSQNPAEAVAALDYLLFKYPEWD